MQELNLFNYNQPQEALRDNIILVAESNADEFIEYLESAEKVAFDIETYSPTIDLKDTLGGLRYWENRIRTLQFAKDTTKCYVIDLKSEFDVYRVLPTIKYVLENPEIAILTQNGKFEYTNMKYHFNIEINRIIDTMILSKLLYGGLPMGHGLKELAKRELGIEDLDKTYQLYDWGNPVLSNGAVNYAAEDVFILHPLYEALWTKIVANKLTTIAGIESACVSVFGDIEVNGVAIDVDSTKASLQVFKDKSNECIKIFQETFPGTSITVSTAKFIVLLQAVLGIELTSCGDSDLAPYDSYPAINALRTYRSLKKSVDYLAGMLLNERNGRVYTSMQQINYAGFGRTSSGKLSKKSTAKDGVNFQQCPNNIKGYPSIRKCFAVPENRSLIIADLSSAHARLAIEFSQDANGLDIYQSGKDIHLFTATGLANKQGHSWTYDDIAAIYEQGSSHPDYATVKQLRNNAKPTLYQSINLAGPATIHATALSQGIPMTLDDAKVASKVFKETYTDLVSYQYFLLGCSRLQSATVNYEGTDYGRVVSKCGRITHIKHLPDRFRPGTSPMAANVVSFAWTAVEATIMKLALAKIRYQGRLHPEWGMMIVNFTHDEINAECNESHAYEVSKCINEAMTDNLRKFTPSLAGCGDMGDINDSICKSWNEK